MVLCRLTDVEYTVQTTSYLVDYREKCRIKVLKPGGARYAKVAVPYKKNMSVGNNISGLRTSFMTIPMERITGNSSFQEQDGPMTDGVFGTDGDENVEDIKATAYNLEGSKVVKTKLNGSSIVKKTIDEQNYLVEFTVPNVKVGTVIEYEYNIHSQLFWELRDWYAQCEIPVVYAKLDMNIPNFLIFNIEDHGIQRLTYTCTVGSLKYKVESDPLTNPMWVNTNHYVYEGRNLMGMSKDDYVWNVQDYCAGITAELKQYRLHGMMQMDYARTWDQIDAMILGSDDLGQHLNDRSPLADELKEAKIADMTNLRERVAAVYRLVMGRVSWNGRYELSPSATDETLRAGGGTNADINLLLIQSLHEVGLTAAPVVLRTRDLGLLPYNFPSVRKLSTFLVGVVMPTGGNLYIDASNRNGWLNVLPDVLLVERARLVRKDRKSEWVNLQKLSRAERSVYIDARLSADGLLSGRQTIRNEGGETVETSYTKRGQVADGRISLCPFPAGMMAYTFNAGHRRMPVELPRIYSYRVNVTIALPDGYVTDGEPRNTTVTTPDRGIEGRMLTTLSEGRIQMSCQLNIHKTTHSEKHYDDLRQLFGMLAAYTGELLVVRRQ